MTDRLPDVEFTEFHCCAEWHISKFESTEFGTISQVAGAAALIYGWALRLSGKKTRQLWTSVPTAAQFLNIGLRTAQRAFKNLRELGLFELLESGQQNAEASLFRILTHKEWQARYPGRCCQKFDPGWAETEQALGIDLHAIAGGKIKFKSFQVYRYRKTGLPDPTIREIFKVWLPRYAERHAQSKHWRKAVPYEFGQHLACIARRIEESPSERDTTIESYLLDWPAPKSVSGGKLGAVCN